MSFNFALAAFVSIHPHFGQSTRKGGRNMQKEKPVTSVFNVGYVDTVIRYVIGVLLLTPVLLQDNILWHLTDFSALLSIYPIVTALIRCDPIYELFGLSTNSHSGLNTGTINQFLETSRIYLFSLPGLGKVHQHHNSENDGSDKLNTARF